MIEKVRPPEKGLLRNMSDFNRIMLDNALAASKDVDAAALIIFLDALDDWDTWKSLEDKGSLILVTQKEEAEKALEPYLDELKAVVRLPEVRFTRLGQIKFATIICITEGIVSGSDTVVCLSGLAAGRRLDTLVVLDLATESDLVKTAGISRDLLERVKPEVFETVLNIAIELASEGREGRPVGSIFVIGDHEKVMSLSRPLIMNPFRGYPESSRNLLDSTVHETIKEFSLLDGAFVIREDGVVESAGMHLDAALEDDGLTPGLGCRHMAAAGITDVTEATAITISGSTGMVRIFRKGKTVMEIERPAVKSIAVSPERPNRG